MNITTPATTKTVLSHTRYRPRKGHHKGPRSAARRRPAELSRPAELTRGELRRIVLDLLG